ncbi:type II secretion system protein N [Ponticaulis sp.]|uniref:type II secretion system protein N n=1 Tax=Ponticaulis sp. TaxID=2020902 RepID=UPI000B6902F7|nr:type II secretion system protein N [Ponticaulis sp.]MAI89697.1 hypothetical protein [Ponticaulis sp.]OUY00714.1 MAG: hypothetical protein CBB65_04600 [Hyphomonadaceae bacterium TMED5]|tara:strand:+ start:92953 stop:93867 length:915 start_codon:yes stop_codon:yes gene_type:complete
MSSHLGQSANAANTGASLLQRKGALGKGVGLAVDLALVLILGLLIARLVWTILSPASFVDVSTTAYRPQASDTEQRIRANPNLLRTFNPFSRELEAAPVTEETDAPETTLNLAIRSIFMSSSSEQSFARIQTPDNEVKRFREGDIILSGVTLERILADRVILSRNGNREALFSRELSVIGDVGETAQSEARAEPVERAAPPQTTNRVDVSTLDEFYRDVTVRRVGRDSGGTVLQIQGSSSSELLARAGLRTNDILLSVNSYDLSEDSLSDLYQTLQSADELDFMVERDGRTFPLTVVIGRDNGQ